MIPINSRNTASGKDQQKHKTPITLKFLACSEGLLLAANWSIDCFTSSGFIESSLKSFVFFKDFKAPSKYLQRIWESIKSLKHNISSIWSTGVLDSILRMGSPELDTYQDFHNNMSVRPTGIINTLLKDRKILTFKVNVLWLTLSNPFYFFFINNIS